MSADPPALRSETLEFLKALLGICLVFAFFGAVLTFFPAIYVASQFGGKAALNAIGALALIVLAASFVVTWKWGTWRNAGGRGVPLPHTSASSPEERLAELLSFTPADLELNRSGRMSRAQRLRLLQADLGWLIFALVCFGEALVLALLMGSPTWQPNFFTGLKGDLIALLGVAWGIWAAARAFKGGVDALRGRVSIERTRLDPYTEESGAGSTVYRLRTDAGQKLKVWEETYDAVAPGTRYLVYFAPLSKTVVSLEDLPTEQPREPPESSYVVSDRRAYIPSKAWSRESLGSVDRNIWQRNEIGWGAVLACVATLLLLIGISNAMEFHTWTGVLDVGAGLASYLPLVGWIAYAPRLPGQRQILWLGRGIALVMTLAIPLAIWVALHGPPCPPTCGPGT